MIYDFFFFLAVLSQRIRQQLDFNHRADAFIQDVVDGIHNRHVYMQVLVQFLDTLGTVVTFGNHFHFYLCALHRIAFTNHGTEHAVAAKVGVGSYKQVAQISRVVDGTFYRMHCIQQAVHFLNGVRDEHSLEVVTILQTITNTGCNRIDILQYRSIFNTYNIRIDRRLDVMAGALLGKQLGFFDVLTSNGKV